MKHIRDLHAGFRAIARLVKGAQGQTGGNGINRSVLDSGVEHPGTGRLGIRVVAGQSADGAGVAPDVR